MSPIGRKFRIARTIVFAIGGVAVLAVLAIVIAIRVGFNTEGDTMGAVQKTAISKDGTVIAYEQAGRGPAVILVSAALADRSGNRRLARVLSDHFTVINYDRRGRGSSSDTQPYAVERELEDIAALIEANGGSAYVFGSSSGSVLALDVATHLGPKVRRLYMYEPPFIVDSSHPAMAETLANDISVRVAKGDRSDAVTLFFTRGMGIPRFAVGLMRFLMPGWSKMCGMAQTIPYDLAILDGTQTGQPLPAERWRRVTIPIMVTVGARSEPFFHKGAEGLVQMLPSARYQSINGLNHGALLLAPAALGKDVQQFFTGH
jgi:pimeloyl-ACP methyl ester carboxylesterase